MSLVIVVKVAVTLAVIIWYSGKILKVMDDYFRLEFQKHLDEDGQRNPLNWLSPDQPPTQDSPRLSKTTKEQEYYEYSYAHSPSRVSQIRTRGRNGDDAGVQHRNYGK